MTFDVNLFAKELKHFGSLPADVREAIIAYHAPKPEPEPLELDDSKSSKQLDRHYRNAGLGWTEDDDETFYCMVLDCGCEERIDHHTKQRLSKHFKRSPAAIYSKWWLMFRATHEQIAQYTEKRQRRLRRNGEKDGTTRPTRNRLLQD